MWFSVRQRRGVCKGGEGIYSIVRKHAIAAGLGEQGQEKLEAVLFLGSSTRSEPSAGAKRLMEIGSPAARWRRICFAAIRLAAFYAIGVFSLLLIVGSLAEGPPFLGDLAELGLPFGIIFSIAFVMLAMARRAGFVALWIVLVGTWVWLLRDGAPFVEVPKVFLGWTILALPLFAIGVLGTTGSDAKQPTLMRGARPLIVLTLWLVAAGIALHSALTTPYMHWHDAPGRFASIFSRIVWMPVPFVVAALETTRLWFATAPEKSQGPPA